MSASTSFVPFDAQAIRGSTLFSNYPWMTDTIVRPGSLENNVVSWLSEHQAVAEAEMELCKACFIIYAFFLPSDLHRSTVDR